MKLFDRLLCTAQVLAVLTLGTPALADQVTVTGLDWDGAKVISQVLVQVIGDKLGTKALVRNGDTKTALASMDVGDGTYDVFPDIWMPNQQAAWDNYIEKRRTIGHNGGYEAVQGFFVPTAIARSLGITSVEDLKRPDIVKRFDAAGTGSATYWAGEQSWGATRLNQIKMKSYGLDAQWKPWIASNGEFKTALQSAITAGTPILFYHWSPEWVFSTYDLTMLKEPSYHKGCDKVFQPAEREDWLEASSFPCAFEASHVYVFYSRTLETRFPGVAAFLNAVAFDPDVINRWVTETGVNGKAPEQVAREWIASNPTIVAKWLVHSAVK